MTLAQQFKQCLKKEESEERFKEWEKLRKEMICEGFLTSVGWCHVSAIFKDGSVYGCSFSGTPQCYFTNFNE